MLVKAVFWYLCLPNTVVEDTVFIECLLINLILLIVIHLFHFFVHVALEERHINTLHVFTSQNMGQILSNNYEIKEIHQLFLIQTTLG